MIPTQDAEGVTGRVVYIVECSDGSLYTGWTVNLARRLAAHNAGRGARYTRSRRPVRLVYFEAVSGLSEALRREAALRRLGREGKLELIAGHGASDTSSGGTAEAQDLLRRPAADA